MTSWLTNPSIIPSSTRWNHRSADLQEPQQETALPELDSWLPGLDVDATTRDRCLSKKFARGMWYVTVISSLVRGRPLDALLRLGNQVRHHVLDELLLVGVHGAVVVDRLHALFAQGHGQGKERRPRHLVCLYKGALRDTSLARQACHDAVRELRTRVGHGEGGRTSAGLGLHHFVTAEHDAVRERIPLLVAEGRRGLGLGEERHDGGAGVPSDHGDLGLQRVEAFGLRDKGARTAHIQGCDTKELLRVVDTPVLQNLRRNGHGRVHGVGDHQDASLWACLRAPSDQVLHDARVDVEEVVTGHAGLAGHAGGNHHHIAAIQGLFQVVAREALRLSARGDVGEVRRHTWGDGRHVEAGQRRHPRVQLQQQRQRLADAACGAQHAALEAALLLQSRRSAD
mmetsp:Transcript_41974/g.110809  ORF Transcript_41974/g.110809 Transcript_41974/m.110809 type:complete len:398 (-) Transcript_41974:121-1314(-)